LGGKGFGVGISEHEANEPFAGDAAAVDFGRSEDPVAGGFYGEVGEILAGAGGLVGEELMGFAGAGVAVRREAGEAAGAAAFAESDCSAVF
jgi:hypothetical protein